MVGILEIIFKFGGSTKNNFIFVGSVVFLVGPQTLFVFLVGPFYFWWVKSFCCIFGGSPRLV